MNIALYFGSFNPVHFGHLIIASYVVEHTSCDQLWFVVSPQNPFKKAASLLNENHRKHLLDLAVETDARFKVSNVEFKLPRPSYTIDTLTHLSETYPAHRFSIVMGSDSFTNVHKWKNSDVLLANYPVIIYQRLGFPVDREKAGSSVCVLEAPLLDISSTYIREQIANVKSIRYLVPEIVREEIVNQAYYR